MHCFLQFSRPVLLAVSLLVQIDIWRAIVTLRTFSSGLYVFRSNYVFKSRIKSAVSQLDFQIKSLTYKVTKHDVSKSETKLNIILNSLSLLNIRLYLLEYTCGQLIQRVIYQIYFKKGYIHYTSCILSNKQFDIICEIQNLCKDKNKTNSK